MDRDASEVDALKVELIGSGERDDRGREVLDCESCGVEERDVLRGASPLCLPSKHVSELRNVLSCDLAVLDGRSELPSM